MRRLFAIGEALIDFIPHVTHSKLKDVEQFSRQVGGAPCNVAATVSKLGGKSEMITQLGNDAFGDIIVETIEQLDVGTQYIKRTNKANTALAFVSLQDDGQRDFSFYRKPSADMLYQPENIDNIQVFQDDILHFCSVDLIESDMKYAHEKMIEKFESVGGTIVLILMYAYLYGKINSNVNVQLMRSYLKLILLKYLMKNYYLLLVRRMKMKQFNLYLEVKLM